MFQKMGQYVTASPPLNRVRTRARKARIFPSPIEKKAGDIQQVAIDISLLENGVFARASASFSRYSMFGCCRKQ